MRFTLGCFLLISSLGASAQQTIPTFAWTQCSKVAWEYRYSRAHGAEVAFPVFSDSLKQLHLQQVVLSGYVLPIRNTEGLLLVSPTPNRHCLHCGGGVSNLVAVVPSYAISPLYDTPLTFIGTLQLNEKGDGWIYYLINAKQVDNTQARFQTVSYD